MEKSKLTAYALNEVTETERAEIEAYLLVHPEMKAEVEEIKLVSSILKSEMATDLVVKAPELKIKKSTDSIWTSLFQQKRLAVGFSIAFVGISSLLVISRMNQETMKPVVPSGPHIEVLAETATTTQPSAASVAQNRETEKATEELSGKVDYLAKDTAASPPVPTGNLVGVSGAGSAAMDGAKRAQTMGSAASESDFRQLSGGGVARKSLVASEAFHRLPPSSPPSEMESGPSQEEYKLNAENDFIQVSKESLSTFSIDVDTASYTNARRYLTSYNQIPPADSIRTEEFINYFDYDYAAPTTGHPIAVHMEATKSPWNAERAIVRVGLKAKELDMKNRPKSNLVFLVDVSGSMEDENKMPLVKSALKTLSEQLGENDRISMVVYAGQSGVILDSEPGNHKDKILSAIQKLSTGGGTNGEGGIRKAYEIAQKNYISGGNNRVILASDGDFNVGVTSPKELLDIIKAKSEGGIFLTVLGFGMGNYKDARLEEISNKGQGNYFYIDNAKEADKVFVNQLAGTLYTVAKDVKVQVEFNPNVVKSYRLVGYENRMLQKEDFANDKVDAGEMGAGHSVTALYEIEWKGSKGSDIKLKYQAKDDNVTSAKPNEAFSDEILTAKIRYKKPTNSSSEFFEQALKNKVLLVKDASCSTRFAIAVAGFSQWMRQSAHVKDLSPKEILETSEGCLSTRDKKDSFKEEFVDLVKKARDIKK